MLQGTLTARWRKTAGAANRALSASHGQGRRKKIKNTRYVWKTADCSLMLSGVLMVLSLLLLLLLWIYPDDCGNEAVGRREGTSFFWLTRIDYLLISQYRHHSRHPLGALATVRTALRRVTSLSSSPPEVREIKLNCQRHMLGEDRTIMKPGTRNARRLDI